MAQGMPHIAASRSRRRSWLGRRPRTLRGAGSSRRTWCRKPSWRRSSSCWNNADTSHLGRSTGRRSSRRTAGSAEGGGRGRKRTWSGCPNSSHTCSSTPRTRSTGPPARRSSSARGTTARTSPGTGSAAGCIWCRLQKHSRTPRSSGRTARRVQRRLGSRCPEDTA